MEMQKQVRRAGFVASKQRPEGRLSSMLRRVFMRRAIVTTCEQAADRFHLITLESPDFRDVEWTPGDKLQIALGSAFVARRVVAHSRPMHCGADLLEICLCTAPSVARPRVKPSWRPRASSYSFGCGALDSCG